MTPPRPTPTYQLGRIAREQGRLDDALGTSRNRPPPGRKARLSEVHRELGAVYLALGRVPDAERELALYTERREYDPEGLYHYGQALERAGRPAEARDAYARAVESARTAPRYRRGIVAKWSRLAAEDPCNA